MSYNIDIENGKKLNEKKYNRVGKNDWSILNSTSTSVCLEQCIFEQI